MEHLLNIDMATYRAVIAISEWKDPGYSLELRIHLRLPLAAYDTGAGASDPKKQNKKNVRVWELAHQSALLCSGCDVLPTGQNL